MNQQRPAILDIRQSSDGNQASVVISLGWRDEEFRGEASGPADESTAIRMVGEATLRAVELVSRGRLACDLLAVATTDLGPVAVALAQVQVGQSGETLVGSSFVDHEDPARAAVKAVLDAVNRRLESIL